MMSETDMSIVRMAAGLLPENATIIEFGPWLGAVSAVLAEYGEVHVVDRFIWTDQNESRVPGVAAVGESFKFAFENFMRLSNYKAIIHVADMREFKWLGKKIDLCMIDAPRKSNDLMGCLQAIASSLHQDTIVLVKNGFNPQYFDMMALVEVLLSQSIFDLIPTNQARWCNIAVLKSGAKFGRMLELKNSVDIFDDYPIRSGTEDAWGGSMLAMARIAQYVHKLDWEKAYDELSNTKPDIENNYNWDIQSNYIGLAEAELGKMVEFSEHLSLHNDPAMNSEARIPFEKSPALARRAYWKHRKSKHWRDRIVDRQTMERVFSENFLYWPAKLEQKIQQRTVLEIGKNLDLSGIGYCVAGVECYVGIDTRKDWLPEYNGGMRDPTRDLPHWLNEALLDLVVVTRLVGFGVPLRNIDFCLVDAADNTSLEISELLRKYFSKNSPSTEFIIIEDSVPSRRL